MLFSLLLVALQLLTTGAEETGGTFLPLLDKLNK